MPNSALVIRRVRPTPGSQLALFTTWDYHVFVTDGDVLQIEADHRRHAVVEQRIAELKSAGLAHLPSGKLHGQRRLARPRDHGPQPRPGHRPARRFRPDGRDSGDSATEGLHDARPTGAQWSTPAPPTALELAMGRGHQHRPGQDHPDPDALLTTTSRPDDQDRGEAGRPVACACPHPKRTPRRAD